MDTKACDMKTFGMIGWSGSGKTTLIIQLIPELIGRGFSVSSMKHTHHNFDIDKPGKDSFEHRVAGAKQVLITGTKRWALLNENRDQEEPDIDALLAKMDPVDLVLIEGFKQHPHYKMEVFRPSVEKPLLALEDSSVVAVATDEEVDSGGLPIVDLNDVAAVADFIIKFCDLEKRFDNGAA
jgi:molybdopterin-guanine dinucleotide biosynthesis adapter protein